jgi:hypothetical protein
MLGGAQAQAGLPDVATGVALSEILAAIYLSAREGREVALAEVRSSRARRPG